MWTAPGDHVLRLSRAEMQKLPLDSVRNIGVANFDMHNLQILMRCPTTHITPAVNQIELHPYRPSQKLLRYCEELGIPCVAFSPLGSRGKPFATEPTILEIAASKGKSLSQVLLMWHLQRKCAVIPSSFNDCDIQSTRICQSRASIRPQTTLLGQRSLHIGCL